jgi:hypothetical protein
MLANGFSSTFRNKASAHAMRNDRVSTTLRARNDRVSAILRAIVLVVLLFGALICGLRAGMTSSAFLYPPEKGVMDTPY